MHKQILALGITAVGLAAAVGVTTSASAATTPTVPTPKAGNITILPTMPRIVGPSAPVSLSTGSQVTLDVGGKTFGDYTVPANATGVTVSITTITPQGTGSLKVWTTGAGEPGTPTVNYNAGETNTALAFVGLDTDGELNVKAVGAGTKFMLGLINYVTPLATPAISSIPANDVVLSHIGPSVRTDNTTPGSGVTDLGSVTLAAGTYDARVIGGFSGLKNTADIPAGTSLLGGLFLTKGAGIPAGFGNVLAQTQGIEIPKTNSGSASYTVDPTAQVDTFITLTESTSVHVQAYAYSSDGADRSALNVHANIASAKFLKLS